jgi:hypothetical protein
MPKTVTEERFLAWASTQRAEKLLCMAFGDAAVRCSDIVNVAVVNGFAGFWLAIRLSDGGSDEIAYATKAEAIKHQLHEQQCAYVKIPPDGMQPKHAESYLRMNRALYNAGMRITDPDDPRRGVILPR